MTLGFLQSAKEGLIQEARTDPERYFSTDNGQFQTEQGIQSVLESSAGIWTDCSPKPQLEVEWLRTDRNPGIRDHREQTLPDHSAEP